MSEINSDQDQQQFQPTPHDEPFFMRLWHWFRRDVRPSTQDREGEGEGNDAFREYWQKHFSLSQDRRVRYQVFTEMDTFDLVTSTLDVYAEESTQKDQDTGRSVWIESKHTHMVNTGEQCLRNLQIEDRLYALVRRSCKMGDDMRRLIYATGKGVLGWKFTEPDKVHRVEDSYDRLVGFRQDGKLFRGLRKYPVSWPWDYVHFRLLGKDEHTTYGTGVLAPAFRAWRQLVLAEDSILNARLNSTSGRNVFWIAKDDAEAVDEINEWRKKFRKNEFVDPASGAYKKTYNPLTTREDVWIPVNDEDTTTRVESLSSSVDPGTLYDLDYFRSKYCGAVKIPPAYFGFTGDGYNSKNGLLQQDVRFARSIKRVQRMLIYGIRRVLDIHFMLQEQGTEEKFNPDRYQYKVMLSAVSYLDEYERLELIRLRTDIMTAVASLGQSLPTIDPAAWAIFILTNYAKLPEDVVLRLVAKKTAPPAEAPAPGTSQYGEAIQRLEEEFRLTPNSLFKDIGKKGFYSINTIEQRIIAEALMSSPVLRATVGRLHEYSMDDVIANQIDSSSRLPAYINSANELVPLTWEDAPDDKEAKLLHQHLLENAKAAQATPAASLYQSDVSERADA
jgi:hypothetical protein